MPVVAAKSRIFTFLPIRLLGPRYIIEYFIFINAFCFLFAMLHEIVFKQRMTSPYLYHALIYYIVFKWSNYVSLSLIDGNLQDY